MFLFVFVFYHATVWMGSNKLNWTEHTVCSGSWVIVVRDKKKLWQKQCSPSLPRGQSNFLISWSSKFETIAFCVSWTRCIASGLISRNTAQIVYTIFKLISFLLYTLSHKSTPDFFDRNLKTDDQIILIFDTNIPDTTGHQMTVQLPPHPMYVPALPGENRTNEIWHFYPRQYHCFIKITQRNTFCPHCCHFGWMFTPKCKMRVFETQCSLSVLVIIQFSVRRINLFNCQRWTEYFTRPWDVSSRYRRTVALSHCVQGKGVFATQINKLNWTEMKQDHQALLMAKYYPRVAASLKISFCTIPLS